MTEGGINWQVPANSGHNPDRPATSSGGKGHAGLAIFARLPPRELLPTLFTRLVRTPRPFPIRVHHHGLSFLALVDLTKLQGRLVVIGIASTR